MGSGAFQTWSEHSCNTIRLLWPPLKIPPCYRQRTMLACMMSTCDSRPPERTSYLLSCQDASWYIVCPSNLIRLAFHVLCMSRFYAWDVYTINTTDCEGPEFDRRDCQVIHFPRHFNKEDLSPIFSIAVSISIIASSFGALVAASYSTFCKFGDVSFESYHDWVTFAWRHLL